MIFYVLLRTALVYCLNKQKYQIFYHGKLTKKKYRNFGFILILIFLICITLHKIKYKFRIGLPPDEKSPISKHSKLVNKSNS